MRPSRLQRKRTRGWRMPAGAVYVGRPSRWGNPWRIGKGRGECTPRAAVANFRRYLRQHPELVEEARPVLAGRDLVCWCREGDPCHADVWLEVVN